MSRCKDMVLRTRVLAKYLEGVRDPALIAQALEQHGREGEIDAYLRSAEFNTLLVRAKKDMAASVIEAIKADLHTFLAEYTELGLDCGDPRVRAAILKDLLDRGGTGAAAKVALTTPEMYRKVLEEYIEKPTNGDGAAPGPAPAHEPASESRRDSTT